mgnify:CR=1 FL=1
MKKIKLLYKKYKEERRGIKHEQSSSCILELNRKHRDHGK